MHHRLRNGLIIGAIVVVLALVVGPWVYLNVIRDDSPERLGFEDAPTTTADDSEDAPSSTGGRAPDDLAGTWVVGAGSEAGYRVDEVLFGQDTEAVGRTSDVTGTLTVTGTTIESATIEVDLTTVESDESRRDNQFRGRIMDTGTFPTATFELTEPLTLDPVPADLEERTSSATGTFTIRGVTNEVTVDLTVRRNGEAFEVTGAVPVVFADYGIPDASFGPATVEDEGEIEFLLVLGRDT